MNLYRQQNIGVEIYAIGIFLKRVFDLIKTKKINSFKNKKFNRFHFVITKKRARQMCLKRCIKNDAGQVLTDEFAHENA